MGQNAREASGLLDENGAVFCPFYGQRMARPRNYHILGFLHFTDNNRNGVDRKDDRLWKLRKLFEIIRTNFQNFQPFRTFGNRWSHCEIHGKGIIQTVHPEKGKRFGIKMLKLCDSTRYTYDMNVYLGKDRQRAEQHLTATHSTVTSLTKG